MYHPAMGTSRMETKKNKTVSSRESALQMIRKTFHNPFSVRKPRFRFDLMSDFTDSCRGVLQEALRESMANGLFQTVCEVFKLLLPRSVLPLNAPTVSIPSSSFSSSS